MSISHLLTFLKKVLTLCLVYSLSRLAFYFYNFSDSEVSHLFLALLEGIRFDISAILYINLPLVLLFIIHYILPQSKIYNRFLSAVFILVNTPFILLNNIDIVFYAFNLKRSTIDFFSFITKDDFFGVYLKYILEYWPVTLLFMAQMLVLCYTLKLPKAIQRKPIDLLLLVFLVGSIVLGLRGGTQLKPIKTINAGVLSSCNESDLVLNTPFTILHSYQQNSLQAYTYFESDQSNYYNTLHRYESDGFSKQNVVIIILESFSKEFVGYYNDGQGYTPFLDSLMSTGLVAQNAYANGVRSIEALPAITASIPSLMTEPFITSSYANNNYTSIASILSKEDYHTSFFHGGQKGTMGFYEFSKKAGFTDYHGREEFNDDRHYDKHWGIYDEPFFSYFAEQLNTIEKPFLSVFFSLTSHPPYHIPAEYENQFPKGELDIHESIAYSDNALSTFFQTAQQMDWFDNTLFVITADHTSPLSNKLAYKNKIGRYAVPMLFWKSDSTLKGSVENTSQHIDILPTVLDLIGYEQEFFSFGQSILQGQDLAVSFLKNEYLMITQDGYLVNKDEVYTTYKDKTLKESMPNSPALVNRLKAIKQGFNNSMITNQMSVYEN